MVGPGTTGLPLAPGGRGAAMMTGVAGCILRVGRDGANQPNGARLQAEVRLTQGKGWGGNVLGTAFGRPNKAFGKVGPTILHSWMSRTGLAATAFTADATAATVTLPVRFTPQPEDSSTPAQHGIGVSGSKRLQGATPSPLP